MDCASCGWRVWLQGVSKHICTACEDGQIPDDSLLHYFITKTQHPKCPFLLSKHIRLTIFNPKGEKLWKKTQTNRY